MAFPEVYTCCFPNGSPSPLKVKAMASELPPGVMRREREGGGERTQECARELRLLLFVPKLARRALPSSPLMSADDVWAAFRPRCRLSRAHSAD